MLEKKTMSWASPALKRYYNTSMNISMENGLVRYQCKVLVLIQSITNDTFFMRSACSRNINRMSTVTSWIWFNHLIILIIILQNHQDYLAHFLSNEPNNLDDFVVSSNKDLKTSHISASS
ncbi:hypothetical protein BpHYR1_027096 [Brachionus plicatilis]|uniref:Uncharacterized protein n=1 Tax=Brachionus plicatilis TaxID=10195 RepID=A0A3M7SLK6_BRAPC|nr:hypothetical protein BpHYR1_027096 [Brachionus plicatilis]